MRRFFTVMPIVASMLVAGCAATPTHHPGGFDNLTIKEPPKNIAEIFGGQRNELIHKILVAEVAVQRRHFDLAVDNYLAVTQVTKDPEIAARTARIASIARRDDAALEAARIWVAGEPDNLEARHFVTVLNLRAGNNAEAEEQLEYLLGVDPDNAGNTLVQIGALLRRELDKATALEVMDHLVARHGELPKAHYARAQMALWAEQPAQALESVDQALTLQPGWIEAVSLKARILRETRDDQAALDFMQGYLKRHSEAHKVRLAYARMLVDMDHLEEARNQFELLAVQVPNDDDVLYALAMLSLQFDELNEAEGYLQQLYKMGQRSEVVPYYLGQVAERREDWAAALDWYAKVRTGDFLLDAQLRISAVLARADGLPAARRHLSQLHPRSLEEHREILMFEGALLRDYKHYEEAYQLYSEALDSLPGDTNLLYSRALVAERLDKLEVAERDLRRIVEQEPENVAALNALGYTLADRTERYDEALEFIKRAFEMEPNDPAIIDSMGWVHYRMGKHEQAIEYLRRAYEQVKDGEIAAHLGEVLWVNGHKDEARQVWNEALEAGDSETLRQTMERFTQ